MAKCYLRQYDDGMIRWLAAVLPLFLSSLAFGQGSNLRVTLTAPPTARLGDVVTVTAVVENVGDAVAPNVRGSIRILPGRQCDEPGLVLGDLAPGDRKVLTCSQEVLDLGLYFLETHAGADSNPPEPDATRSDNFARAYTERLSEGTQLGLFANPLPTARPGLSFPMTVVYWNSSRTPATNAKVIFTLSKGAFAELPATCVAEGTRATCALGTVPPAPDPGTGKNHVFQLSAIAPDESDAEFRVDVELRSDQTDDKPADNTAVLTTRTFHTIYVREAAESALRAAMATAGVECTGAPCLIAFRIPNPEGAKVHSFRLTEPLDFVRGLKVQIDGTTQTGYFGDTNPDGPEIELDGSALTEGDGLRIPGVCGILVRGLVLNGFPGSAISLHDPRDTRCNDPFTLIEDNYIGTDSTGTRAIPNERGIVSSSGHPFTARNNVISGNRRSAVYVERGRGLIQRNTIGLNRTHDAPLPNGASGVYISALGGGTDVDDNYIGFNAHFGVAIDRGADHVALHGNSFQANGGAAIDWGLDGPENGGRVPAPSIRSATYANGVTTIEVDAAPVGFSPEVNVYASDAPDLSGYAEGQYFLGMVRSPHRIVVPLDLRGKWITATLTESVFYGIVQSSSNTGYSTTTTSEMSRAVEVK
jgi:hypothetical protein